MRITDTTVALVTGGASGDASGGHAAAGDQRGDQSKGQ